MNKKQKTYLALASLSAVSILMMGGQSTEVNAETVNVKDSIAPTFTQLSTAKVMTSNGIYQNILTFKVADNVAVRDVQILKDNRLVRGYTLNTQNATLQHVFKEEGTYTIRVTDVNGNVRIQKYVVSGLIEKVAPVINVRNIQELNNGKEALLVVTASDNAGIQEIRYLKNGTSLSQVKAMGQIGFKTSSLSQQNVTASMSLNSNGIYGIYVRDVNGNESFKTVSVNVIDNIKPTVSLNVVTNKIVDRQVAVQIVASDNKGVKEVRYAKGSLSEVQMRTAGQLTGSSFIATSNGVYTVYVKDVNGNETVKTIVVNNIDMALPYLSGYSYNATTKTVTIKASDDRGVQSIILNGQRVNAPSGTFKVNGPGQYYVTIIDISGKAISQQITIR